MEAELVADHRTELNQLQKLYVMIEDLHSKDSDPILSMYKACTAENCQNLTLVDLAKKPGSEIFPISDIGDLKPVLGHRPGVGVLHKESCDLYILFKGQATFA